MHKNLENLHHDKIKNFLKNKKIFNLIDVGAHNGGFTKNLNLKFLKNAYYFEPNFILHKELKNNLSKFNFKKKIFKIALSNIKGSSIFLINRNLGTSSLNKNINKMSYLYLIKVKLLNQEYYKRIKVKTEKLDNFSNLINFKNSILKIDTEGNELSVLEGAKQTIKKIDYILIEIKILNLYKNYKISKIYSILKKNNFVKIKTFSTFPYIYKDVLFKKVEV